MAPTICLNLSCPPLLLWLFTLPCALSFFPHSVFMCMSVYVCVCVCACPCDCLSGNISTGPGRSRSSCLLSCNEFFKYSNFPQPPCQITVSDHLVCEFNLILEALIICCFLHSTSTCSPLPGAVQPPPLSSLCAIPK